MGGCSSKFSAALLLQSRLPNYLKWEIGLSGFRQCSYTGGMKPCRCSVLIALPVVLPLLLAGVPDPAPVAVAPIKIPARIVLERDRLAAQSNWCQRVWVMPFKARVQTNAWAASATQFVEQGLAAWLNAPLAGQPAELAATGRQLCDQGCDEPLVWYLTGLFEYRANDDWRTADPFFKRAEKAATTDRRVPPSLAFWIAVDYARVRARGLYGVADLAQNAATATKAAVGKDYVAGDEIIFVRHQLTGVLTDCTATNYYTRLAATYTGADLPEWARRTLVGMTELRLAWSARGSGWARDVKETGWEGFAKHLDLAHAELTQAWNLRPDRPEAAAELIEVVMGSTGTTNETTRQWFDRAVTAQFDYEPAYVKLLWAYRPRWHGSHELMLEFGKACVATHRYDTVVPTMFFEATYGVESEGVPWRTLYRRSDIAQTYMELSQGLLTEPTRQSEHDLRLSAQALNAWLTGDYRTAAQTLRKVGPQLHPTVVRWLNARNADEATMRGEIAVYAGSGRATFQEAESAYAAGRLTAARADYQKAAGQSPPEAQLMITNRLNWIAFEESLATGNWVKLMPDPRLSEWSRLHGNWSVETNGTLVLKGTDDQATLFYGGRVGPAFEMRGEFEIDAPQNCCRGFGLAFGWNNAHRENWVTCQLTQGGHSPITVWLFDQWDNLKESKPAAAAAAQNKFFLRSRAGRVTFELNGRKIFDELQSKRPAPDMADGQIGFHMSRACRLNTWRIHDLEVRRLASE